MRRRGAIADDEGFTLVELIVYGLLLVVVLSVVAGLFVSLYSTQKSVDAVTDATTDGQSANDSIQSGIRNSTAFALVSNGTDQLLIAVGGGAGVAGCQGQAWYYSAGEHSIRTTWLTEALDSVPDESMVASWTLLAGDIEPITGTTVFTTRASASDPTLTPVFSSASDPTLTLAFSAAAGSGSRVQFSSSVTSRSSVGRTAGTDDESAETDVSACYSGN